MKIIIFSLLISIFPFLSENLFSAEHVFLKNGTIIEGRIIGANNRQVKIDDKSKIFLIPRYKILRIIYNDLYKKKVYVYYKGNKRKTEEGYLVHQTAYYYYLRKELNSPQEKRIYKKYVLFVSQNPVKLREKTDKLKIKQKAALSVWDDSYVGFMMPFGVYWGDLNYYPIMWSGFNIFYVNSYKSLFHWGVRGGILVLPNLTMRQENSPEAPVLLEVMGTIGLNFLFNDRIAMTIFGGLGISETANSARFFTPGSGVSLLFDVGITIPIRIYKNQCIQLQVEYLMVMTFGGMDIYNKDVNYGSSYVDFKRVLLIGIGLNW